MRSRTAPLLVAAAGLIAVLPLVAQNAPTALPPHAGGQAHHPMKLPKPTNLQVLPKDISGEQLMATMRGFTKALGVECGFCHAEDPTTHKLNFALDTKDDKGTARTMIRMTQEINAKYLATIQDPDATPADKTVTCGTCHRGKSMPAPFVAPPEQHHEMPAKSE